ncbi:hypothetical protein GN156_21105, partial [bacterium LRH843]|nr:hypothetical protein [bacterium LRH843]
MLFKYDLDKFDPLGTKKIQETIARMTKPPRDWAAIINPYGKVQAEIAAMQKSIAPTRTQANLAAMVDPLNARFPDINDPVNKAYARMTELTNPFNKAYV